MMTRREVSHWLPVGVLGMALGLALLGSPGCNLTSPPAIVAVVVTATPGGVTESKSPVPTPAPGAESRAEGIILDGTAVLSETMILTLTVQSASPTAYLFDTPELDGHPPTPDSLEVAHFALLDCTMRGQAGVRLEFPMPKGELPWVLVFNPRHQPEDHVAPRVEVEVTP